MTQGSFSLWKRHRVILMLAIVMTWAITSSVIQVRPAEEQNTLVDPVLYQGLRYRSVGPHRGGRVTAVAGVRTQPATFYMGATGGGIWKTTNYGILWEPVSD